MIPKNGNRLSEKIMLKQEWQGLKSLNPNRLRSRLGYVWPQGFASIIGRWLHCDCNIAA